MQVNPYSVKKGCTLSIAIDVEWSTVRAYELTKFLYALLLVWTLYALRKYDNSWCTYNNLYVIYRNARNICELKLCVSAG